MGGLPIGYTKGVPLRGVQHSRLGGSGPYGGSVLRLILARSFQLDYLTSLAGHI